MRKHFNVAQLLVGLGVHWDPKNVTSDKSIYTFHYKGEH